MAPHKQQQGDGGGTSPLYAVFKKPKLSTK